ncbi:serpin B [Rhabdobacter roseus]|uniref:Serpin B n=1 Tax=Rhabdobacter roseus TaxID=1655419 RepID=A0A840TFY1_9BACT|nr:serpin family protein [Rhabdobacter roseus]MBB5282101.1 serpin B [Rhabdobacter roseus]
MKTLKTMALAGAVLAGMGSCREGSTQDPTPITRSVQVSPRVAARTTDFAFDFFQSLQATQPADKNLFVSPLSLHIALGMLLNGAAGETAQQIQNALKLEGLTQAELNEAYQTLMKDLPQADSKVDLGLANSVWYRNSFQVETDFLNVLRQSFGAEVSAQDFGNPATVNKINQWASDHTNGKVKKVLERVEPNQVMFLLNALYFKGDWAKKFNAASTQDAPFHLGNGSQKTVKMMKQEGRFSAATTEGYKALQLPYSSGQFNLTLLMPQGNATIQSLVDQFGSADWATLQSTLRPQEVEVGLPRFTLDYEVNLNSTLEKMGIRRVFTGAAELTGISKNDQLLVSFVKQNTYLGVDEKGTEAAAVTTIGIELTSAPAQAVPYIFDRPFVFIISEKTSNTILFAGRIMNP